jgi:hypothetical protein
MIENHGGTARSEIKKKLVRLARGVERGRRRIKTESRQEKTISIHQPQQRWVRRLVGLALFGQREGSKLRVGTRSIGSSSHIDCKEQAFHLERLPSSDGCTGSFGVGKTRKQKRSACWHHEQGQPHWQRYPVGGDGWHPP